MYIVLNKTEDKVLSIGGWFEATTMNKCRQALETENNAKRRLKRVLGELHEAINFWSEETEMTGDNPPQDPKDIVVELKGMLKSFEGAKIKEINQGEIIMRARNYICCICGNHCQGYGNNPAGAMMRDDEGNVVELSFQPEDECCNDCNTRYVIPGRIYKMSRGR